MSGIKGAPVFYLLYLKAPFLFSARMCGAGDKWCRAPAHKLGPGGDITHQGAGGRNILVNQIQEANMTQKLQMRASRQL